MDTLTDTGKPASLYEALKNSQPIAFMSSLSFVIAALIIRTGEEQTAIYDAAVTAAILFLIAFIVSLARQSRFSPSRTDELTMIDFTTYFFLLVGVFYWFVVAYEFSKQLNSINIVLGTYLTAFMGSSAIFGAIRSYQKKTVKSTLRRVSDASLLVGGGLILLFSAWLIIPTIGVDTKFIPYWIPVWGMIAGTITMIFSTLVHLREDKLSKKSST